MEYFNVLTDEYLSSLQSNIIEHCTKIELLDYNENFIADISKYISKENSGSISVNFQQGVRRSCDFCLVNKDGVFDLTSVLKINNIEDIDNQTKYKIWSQSKFKIYKGIKIKKYSSVSNPISIDTQNNLLYNTNQEISYKNDTNIAEEDIYWFSQGVYILTHPSQSKEGGANLINISTVDKFGIFGSETQFHETEGTYLIPMGTKVKNIIKDILNLNLGNGYLFDPKEPNIDNVIGEMTLPYDIKKSPETYFSDILIELGNIFACDVYYDVNGVLNFTKGNENLDFNKKPSLYDFSDSNRNFYFQPVVELDFENIYNVIKVIGDNPTTGIYAAILKNTNLNSPTCIQRVGEKIKYIESSFCYDESRAQQFAKYLLNKYSRIQAALSFQTTLVPHLDVNNVVTITDKNFKYYLERFILQSITIPFNSSTPMDIQATNTASIPYFEF